MAKKKVALGALALIRARYYCRFERHCIPQAMHATILQPQGFCGLRLLPLHGKYSIRNTASLSPVADPRVTANRLVVSYATISLVGPRNRDAKHYIHSFTILSPLHLPPALIFHLSRFAHLPYLSHLSCLFLRTWLVLRLPPRTGEARQPTASLPSFVHQN